MTYNIHQGFNTSGVLDPEAIALQIEASNATVVALQEVSRGWVVNGSADLLEWLAERLEMFAYFGPTAGPLWGNALLSEQPLELVSSHPLLPTDLPLRRGYLDAQLDYGGLSLRILVTHLHHRNRESAVREIQVRELIAEWNESTTTILTGDLNADPESAAMRMLQASGFSSAGDLLPMDRRATILRPDRNRQIDYIWVTSDLHIHDVEIPLSDASDHLPLVATVTPISPLR